MSGWVPVVLQALGVGVTVPGVSWILQAGRGTLPEVWGRRGMLTVAAGSSLESVALFMRGFWMVGGFFAVIAAGALWTWWKMRPPRDRRKAFRELGAKSRARVRVLVERVKPSPVPFPGRV